MSQNLIPRKFYEEMVKMAKQSRPLRNSQIKFIDTEKKYDGQIIICSSRKVGKSALIQVLNRQRSLCLDENFGAKD